MVAGKKSSGKGMLVINRNAAGIDIGSERHYVAIGEGRGESAVRSFGCYTAGSAGDGAVADGLWGEDGGDGVYRGVLDFGASVY